MGELKERMLRRMELKSFSKRTIQIYLFHMQRFVAHYGKSPNLLGKSEIEEYLHYLLREKTSGSGMAQAYSALKFFYSDCLERGWALDKIPRPKQIKKLPIVFSLKEVKDIIGNVGNIKNQTILMTIYSAGLRLSEAVNLKLKDIDSSRMQIRVEQGKGKKDRYTLLSDVMLSRLREYYKKYKPKLWLFPGESNKPISPSTVQKAFGGAKKKRGLKRKPQYTRYAIVLRPTCWKTAVIYLQSNHYLAIRA